MPKSAATVSKSPETPAQRHSSTANPPLRVIKRNGKSDTVILLGKDGHKHHMDLAAVDQLVHWACAGIADVQTHQLIARCRKSLYNGMKAGEVGTALVTAAVPLMETGPGYSQVCARLLLDSLWAEVSSRLGLQTAHGGDFRSGEYPGLFKASIHTGIELGLLPDSLLSYDLDRLAQALRPEYDSLFSYPRLQSLYERGLLQSQGTRLELPQSYFMRIAMSSALTENDFNARAIEFYQVLSRFDYMSSTPTPFNADTHHPQLSPCYPTTVQDKAEPEPSPVTKPLPAAEAIRQSLATHDINHP